MHCPQLVAHCSVKQPGWPVGLVDPVALPEGAPQPGAAPQPAALPKATASAAQESILTPKAIVNDPEPQAAPTSEPNTAPAANTSSVAVAFVNDYGPFWHGNATKAAADALLAKKADGTFLFREHGTAGEFILSVVFRGKPTHHLVNRLAPGSPLKVNKREQPVEITTIAKVGEPFVKLYLTGLLHTRGRGNPTLRLKP